MSTLLKTTVGEIAAAKPPAAVLFDILGIDYSRHGNLALRDACAAAGLDPVLIRKSLEQLQRGELDINWLEQPLTALTRHLRDELQPAIEEANRSLAGALSDSCAKCEAHTGPTGKLRRAFVVLSGMIGPHMSRERQILLPVLEHVDACWSSGDAPSMRLTGGFGPAIQVFVAEHGRMIGHLDEMRALVDEMIQAGNPCLDVLDRVRTFDREIREHVHLENNVLFSRAMALESIFAGTPQKGSGGRSR